MRVWDIQRFKIHLPTSHKVTKTLIPTDDREEGRGHEESVQNTHDGRDGYLGVTLGYKADDDVEDGRNARDDDGNCAFDFKDELESTWQEKRQKERGGFNKEQMQVLCQVINTDVLGQGACPGRQYYLT